MATMCPSIRATSSRAAADGLQQVPRAACPDSKSGAARAPAAPPARRRTHSSWLFVGRLRPGGFVVPFMAGGRAMVAAGRGQGVGHECLTNHGVWGATSDVGRCTMYQ